MRPDNGANGTRPLAAISVRPPQGHNESDPIWAPLVMAQNYHAARIGLVGSSSRHRGAPGMLEQPVGTCWPGGLQEERKRVRAAGWQYARARPMWAGSALSAVVCAARCLGAAGRRLAARRPRALCLTEPAN